MAIRRMRVGCWMPKATDTNSECAIHVSFPLQQWLHERASILRHTYTACVVFLDLDQCWRGTVQYIAFPVGFPSSYLIQSIIEFQNKVVGRMHIRNLSKQIE